MRPANCTKQARGRRTSELRRSSAPHLCSRLTEYRQKSLARDMAFAKQQSRILSAAEAVQAAKLHSEMLPEQQAIMLSAEGPGTATCWTAMHKSPTELAQNAQLRLGTCALRKGNDEDMCEQYGGDRPHRAVQRTLRRLIEQAGAVRGAPCP